MSFHYNGADNYLFLNGTETNKFAVKDSEIVATSLRLGNISKDWLIDNLKKTILNGYVDHFSVGYDAIVVADIIDIHKYLMKKNEKWDEKWNEKCWDLLKGWLLQHYHFLIVT